MKLHPYSCVLLMTGISPVSLPTYAQEPEPVFDLAIADVIATAQRTTQSIQTTPVSISALIGEDIERYQIDHPRDLSHVIPNTNIVAVSGGSMGIKPYVRGGGVSDGAGITSEADVGFYIDDIFQPRFAAIFTEMLNLERVEVLRGPQGTLYGRNSSDGAVKFITKKPQDYLHVVNEAGIGRWGERFNKLVIENALNEEGTLKGGFSGMYRTRDGGQQYAETLMKEVGAEDLAGFHTDLVYDADSFSARLKGWYVDYESDGTYASAVDLSTLNLPYDQWGYTSGSIARVLSPRASYTDDIQKGISFHISVPVDSTLTINSITSWNELTDNWAIGFSGGVFLPEFGETPVELFDRESTSDQKAITQEIQVQGKLADGLVSYIGGLYYFYESGTQLFDSQIFFRDADTFFDVETNSYALFGQSTIHLDNALNLTVGGRYTKDEKQLDAIINSQVVTADDSFSNFSPRIGLDFQYSPDLFVYATFTGGFKAGGYYSLASTAEALSEPFQPQKMNAYELGIKSDWLNNQFRFNTAIFFNDYENLQQQAVTPEGVFVIENYDAEHYGVEIELRARLSEYVAVWGNGVVQSSEYTGMSGSAGDVSGNLLGNEMTNVFDDQVTIGTDISVEHENSTSVFSVSINRRNDYFAAADNAPIGHIPAQTMINMFASYSVDNWKIKAGVQNATDEQYWRAGFGFGPVQPRLLADRKIWRLSVVYDFSL